MFLMGTITSIAKVIPARQKEGEIWLRPIKETVEIDIKGKRYNFCSGEIVRVQGEQNGNIIIGGDTLPTDEDRLTVYKLRWVVDSMYLAKFPDFGQCFSAIDSTKIKIDLTKVPTTGYLHIFNPANGKYLSIPYGITDTLILESIGMKPGESELRYIPDSIYGGVATIKYDTESDPSQTEEAGISKWIPYAVCVFIIVGIILFFVLFIHRKKNDINVSLLKAISKLQSIVKSLYFELKQSEIQDGLNLYSAIENLNNTANSLKDVLKHNTLVKEEHVNKDSINEIYRNIDDIKQIQKSYENIGKQRVGDGYIHCLKNLREKCESSNILLSNLLDSINSAIPSQNLSDIEKDDAHNGITSTDIYKDDSKDDASQHSSLRKEIDSLKQKLAKAQRDAVSLRNDLNDERKTKDEVIKTKVDEAKENFDKKLRVAEIKAEKAENKAKTVADELNNKFDKERQRYVEENKTLNSTLTDTKKQLNQTANDLSSEISAHNATKRVVAQLTAETNAFKDHLSGVTDSIPYCEHIYDLITLSVDLQSTASDILESDLSDPYFAYKAVALFSSKLNSINLPAFYTDVEMVAKAGFVIKGTPLATYDKKKSAKELENLTKNYFFTTYLKTYVDALLVLNESLIGLKYLIDDVKPSHIRTLEEYRESIEKIVQNLGIQVLTVKIFDSVGVNTDLLATEIDAGYDKHGAILEIENCKVSLIGGMPDNQRIVVKIQK